METLFGPDKPKFDVAVAVAMYNEGKTLGQIATHFGVASKTRDAIKKALREAGVEIEKKRLWPKDHKLKDQSTKQIQMDEIVHWSDAHWLANVDGELDELHNEIAAVAGIDMRQLRTCTDPLALFLAVDHCKAGCWSLETTKAVVARLREVLPKLPSKWVRETVLYQVRGIEDDYIRHGRPFKYWDYPMR